MKVSNARRFSEALGSWLHFEACCFRAGLFSESSFKAAIGSVASSLHASHPAARVHADYELAAIQRASVDGAPTRGRKKSVDFALIYDDGRVRPSAPELLIEAKWAGSSHCSTSNIVADLIRLAIMKRAHPDAICLFVLAGRYSDVAKVLSKAPFTGATNKRKDAVGHATNMRKFAFRERSEEHQKQFGAAINSFREAGLPVPSGFSVTSTACYPPQSSAYTVKFQAVAWEVFYVPTTNLRSQDWPPPVKRSKQRRELEEIE